MTNLTDLLDPLGDASRVLIRYADRLLVVQHRDHHELLSLDDNGATWSDNPARLREWHREVAAGHAAAIAASDAMVTEIRAATGYLRRARTLLGFKRMVGAVGPAFLHMQDSEDIPTGLTVCQRGNLDRDPLYLGCANGVVDLNVGRLLPPEEGRRQLISRNTGVSFDPEAQDGAVDDLLTILSPPERSHLLASLGHALRGGSPGRWYVLCGVAGSGKSTLLRTIAAALGGYAFFLADGLMISGRHTSSRRFADHLSDFTRGRIALGDGWPGGGARLNVQLVRTLTGRDPLPRWDEHGLDGEPAPVTATIFQAMYPQDIDQLDLSDPPLVDRTHVLSCLPPHGRTIGGGLFLDPFTDQAGQAMLALLVQHAAANREPPDAPASVTGLVRERRRASIGSVGRWLVDHLQVTGEGDEMILADEIMAALAEDIPPDAQDQFQGRTRREILHLARDLIQGFPTARRVKRGGRLLSAYPGVRLLTTADIHPAGAALPADIEARRAAAAETPAAETPAAYTLGYCRACRIFLLEILQQHHLPWHTEEELRRQHPCFRCETLLPAGDPFQLVCADCAGKPREDLETQTAVMTAIAAEMVEPAEGMAAHLQTQIDHVHQFLHQKINAEKAEEEENGGG